jgi:hypothetical protein
MTWGPAIGVVIAATTGHLVLAGLSPAPVAWALAGGTRGPGIADRNLPALALALRVGGCIAGRGLDAGFFSTISPFRSPHL